MTRRHDDSRTATIPEQLPVLTRGAHRHSGQGACLMEYTALLTGDRFSDRPRCTHPALAELARQVNDRLSGRTRPSLITRAPALAAIGAAHAGVAAAVAGAVVTANWQHAAHSALLPWRTRRAARLRRGDIAGRGWWGRQRDLMSTYGLVTAGLDQLSRSAPDPEVRDKVLLEVLDCALTECAFTPPIVKARAAIGDSPRRG
jgi:hypothetical protein